MRRNLLKYLVKWKNKAHRKPLILRGARQVGKSYLVRQFAKAEFLTLVEINIERDPGTAELIANHPPKKVIQLLEAQLNTTIKPGEALLFLDEIQASEKVIAALRYFHEELPELHIIAAGSLLDFVLRTPKISIPVGRIEYCYLGPLTFEEFMLALNETGLLKYLSQYSLIEETPKSIHEKLLQLIKTYWIVGGMPESVAKYQKSESFQVVDEIKHSILDTYRDDFHKYGERVDLRALTKVFQKIPLLVGQKVKYVNIDPEERSTKLAEALNLLVLARVISKIHHTSANGIPLGAEINEKVFKVIFLDIGLLCTACGLRANMFEAIAELNTINRGAVAEQFVGQQLLWTDEPYIPPELFYWNREKKNSSAEVDYLISEGSHIIPIETKAGKTGTLKSLHLFLRQKSRNLAVRFNSEPPSFLSTQISMPLSDEMLNFSLLSLPHYLIGQLQRLIRESMAKIEK